MNFKPYILIKSHAYENNSTTLKLYPNNGFWSGYICVYDSNDHLKLLVDKLFNYSGKRLEAFEWRLGDSISESAYKLLISCIPVDGAGHSVLRISIEYHQVNNGGKSCDLEFNVIPPEINELGNLLKYSISIDNDQDNYWYCESVV